MELTPSPLPIRMLTDDGRLLRCKIIQIGTWNMNTTFIKSVAHGLGTKWTQILHASAYIINDMNSSRLNLDTFNDFPDPNLLNGGCGGWNDTNIVLRSRTGGMFDSLDYESVAINRGFVVVWYYE